MPLSLFATFLDARNARNVQVRATKQSRSVKETFSYRRLQNKNEFRRQLSTFTKLLIQPVPNNNGQEDERSRW